MTFLNFRGRWLSSKKRTSVVGQFELGADAPLGRPLPTRCGGKAQFRQRPWLRILHLLAHLARMGHRLFSVIASIPRSAYGMAGVDSSFAACDARRTTS